MITQPTPAMSPEEAQAILAQYFKEELVVAARKSSIVDWAEANYYIPQTQSRINLVPHQKTILNLMFDPHEAFQTLGYSAPKKSGKTAINGVIGRYVAENYGRANEVYAMANDEEQSRGRIYKAIVDSIEADPRYHAAHNGIKDYWRIIRRELTHLPSNSIIRAVSNDYQGEAGSNPTATLWTEIWGLTSERDIRFWEELTPVPTRPYSFRSIDTYAGYVGESTILEDLYERCVKNATRLTHNDLIKYGGWPFPDDPPLYVNPIMRSCFYWDDGPVARRMPWQTPAYYAAQAATITRPEQFDRLHNNYWISATSAFIPIEWWDVLYDPTIPPPNKTEPLVIGVDASVSGDCTGIVVVSRDPKNSKHTQVRDTRMWSPPRGQAINYKAEGGLWDTLLYYARNYNVVEVAYDAYQMHHFMNELRQLDIVNCRQFGQQKPRELADKQLYDVIVHRELHHRNDPDLRQHIQNCGAKLSKDEDHKMRLVKVREDRHIDLAVCTSMAVEECLRLILD